MLHILENQYVAIVFEVGAKDSMGESHLRDPSYSSKPCVVGRFVFYEERKGTLHVPNNHKRSLYFSVFTFEHPFSFTISISRFHWGLLKRMKKKRLATCNELLLKLFKKNEYAFFLLHVDTLVLYTKTSIIVGTMIVLG